MRLIERTEVLTIGDYEPIRPHFRKRVIEEKRARRVVIGPHLSAVFENRDTVLLQIQEMLRTERITSEPAVLHEIETYNELVPGEGELSLTLFVEIADREVRERTLVELAGLEDVIAFELAGERYPLRGKFHGVLEGRTTAVHYLKAKLPPAAVATLTGADRHAAKAALVVAHPKYHERKELERATVDALANDLRAS